MSSSDADVSSLIGPVEIGALVSAILLGCAILQGCFYYCNLESDSCKRKAFVVGSIVVDTIHFVFCAAMLWSLTISDFGNIKKVKAFPTSTLSGTATMTAVMNILTQSYYAYRLWKLSGRFILPTLVVISTAMSTTVTLYCAAEIVLHNAEWLDIHRWLIIFGLASEIWGSILITGGTAWFLSKSKSWALRNTVRQIDRLIVWTFEIALPPSICRIVALICVVRYVGTNFWLSPYIIIAGVQTNCLIAVVNNTVALRKDSRVHIFQMEHGSRPMSFEIHVDESVRNGRQYNTRKELQLPSNVLMSDSAVAIQNSSGGDWAGMSS